MTPRYRVLILCTGNSARSQMAEGLINRLRGDRWEAFSAGTHPAGFVHPYAWEAMREIGIDISAQRSKSFEIYRRESFDLVITVCDSAAEECPVWLGPDRRVHLPFSDPNGKPLLAFQMVRDELRSRLIPFLDRCIGRMDDGATSS